MTARIKLTVPAALITVVLCALPAFTTAPNDSSRWNTTDEKRQECNNCYNYATNQPNGAFAQPGWASGIMNQSPYTCGGLLAGAEGDGLTFAGRTLDEARTRCGEDCCLVALVISESDYHWYREDDDGTWSHKPGSYPAANTDGFHEPITDPATANHNYGTPARNYSTFCGFMCVCRDDLMPLEGRKPAQPVPPDWYADCPFPCVEDFPGCTPSRTPTEDPDPGCCCSCVLRILDVNKYECK